MLLVVCCVCDDDVIQNYQILGFVFAFVVWCFGSLDLALLLERRFFGLKISKCYDRKKGKNVQGENENFSHSVGFEPTHGFPYLISSQAP